MFLLATIVELLTICAATIQVMPKHPLTNYNRQEIPIIHKIDLYTTPKSIRFPEHFFRNVYRMPSRSGTLKGMQYAPLHADFSKPTLTTKNTSNSFATTTAYRKLYKEHLEPRLQHSQNAQHQNSKCYNYSPGHNVEVLASVSRSPGHNAIYRSFPLIVPRDKPFKANRRNQDGNEKSVGVNKGLKKLPFGNSSNTPWITKSETKNNESILVNLLRSSVNYMRPYAIHQNIDLLPIPSTVVPFLSDDANSRPLAITKHQELNHEILDKDVDLGAAKGKRHPFSPYNKFHRLHLNIARVYSPGQMPAKPARYAGTYSMNVDADIVQSQAELSPLFHLSDQSKGIIYPVPE